MKKVNFVTRGSVFYQKKPFDALFFHSKIEIAMSSLDNPVLMLNRLWQPVHICGVKRAVGLLFLGHAQVVHSDEESGFASYDLDTWMAVSQDHTGAEVIHTVSHRFLAPAIIVLKRYDRLPKQEIRFSRQSIFERDHFTCQYCGKRFDSRDLNLDHVIPRDKGGQTTWENVVCSCISCNTRKANKLPAQARMFPLSEPKQPRWRPFFDPRATMRIAHSSWHPFIGSLPGEVMISS